ncbi:MAG: SIS domain-containing protein [Aureispira sp.]|nr:SIS domain-containing protein [Aureispira sp.]
MSIPTIKKILANSIWVKQEILKNDHLLKKIEQTVEICIQAFQNKQKVLFCGNGGSAADAQHIAAELSGRFYKDRPALFAEALHVNGSYLTAVANDYGYDAIYARLVDGIGQKGDILFTLSTSGNSTNIVNAAQVAQQKGIHVVAMTGSTGGQLKELSQILINVPSDDTPRIQEAHITIGHIICELVEAALFSD